jgi:hypothetical protein
MNETNRWLDGCGDIMIMISARGRSSFSLLPESLASNYLLVRSITRLLLTTISWFHSQAVTRKYDHHTNAQLYMWHGLYVREIMHTSCHQYRLYGLSLSNDRLHAFSSKITANLTFLPCVRALYSCASRYMWDWFAIRNTTVSYWHSSLHNQPHCQADLICLACLAWTHRFILSQVVSRFDLYSCNLHTCWQRLIASWAWTHGGSSNIDHRSYGQFVNRLEICSSQMMQVRNLLTIIFLRDRTLGMSLWRGPQTSTTRFYDQVVNRFEVCSFWMVKVRNLPTIFSLRSNVAYHITITVLIGGNIELLVWSNTQCMWWYLLLT